MALRKISSSAFFLFKGFTRTRAFIAAAGIHTSLKYFEHLSANKQLDKRHLVTTDL